MNKNNRRSLNVILIISVIILFGLIGHVVAFKNLNAGKPKHDEKTVGKRQNQQADFFQAELMLDFFRDLAKGKLNPEQVDAILGAKGTELIIAQQNIMGRVNKEQYRQLLMSLLDDEMPQIEPMDSSERAKLGASRLSEIRQSWRWSMEHTALLEEKMNSLTKLDIYSRAKDFAESYLPMSIKTTPRIFFVMGGRAGFAAIEDCIYMDVLIMIFSRAYRNRPHIIDSEVIEYFAHEMHHVGFSEVVEPLNHTLHLDEKEGRAFGVLKGLTAEGSATYLVSNHRDIESMRQLPRYARYFEKGDSLLGIVQDILFGVLSGEIATDDDYNRANTLRLGHGYHVTGSVIFHVIDQAEGWESMMKVISDPRLILEEYNKAAEKLNGQSESVFYFDTELAGQASAMGE